MFKEPRLAVIDALRTPFVKAGAEFQDITAVNLGRVVLCELLERLELNGRSLDEVIVGNVAQPPDAANIARVIALGARIPKEVPAYTVHRNCASGLQALTSACEKVKLDPQKTIAAVGVESMSNIPLLFKKQTAKIFADLAKARTPLQRLSLMMRFRPQHFAPEIGLILGLTDPVCELNMGQTAEVLVKEFKLSREAQDEFSLQSHQRAVKATKEGKLKEEIIAVIVPPKYGKVVENDIGMRENQTMEALAKLKPIFEKEYGTVTAGNSSMVTDGAVSALVMNEEKAKALGYNPLGYIKSYAYAGCDPDKMGLGPSYATPLALRKANLTLRDINLIELNEAFAAVVLANMICFSSYEFAKNIGLSQPIGEINPDILNVNGGAIALGHPVGATGLRLVLTILKEMKRQNLKYGLVTLCIGGGQGGAMVVERE